MRVYINEIETYIYKETLFSLRDKVNSNADICIINGFWKRKMLV